MATKEQTQLAIAAGRLLAERWGEPLSKDTLLGGCRDLARGIQLQGGSVRYLELYSAARAELGWS